MSKVDGGGPAFPFVEPNTACAVAPGMSLRDYFAAKAMQEHMRAMTNAALGTPGEWNKAIAEMAYLTADAMLKVRSASEDKTP